MSPTPFEWMRAAWREKLLGLLGRLRRSPIRSLWLILAIAQPLLIGIKLIVGDAFPWVVALIPVWTGIGFLVEERWRRHG